jgi:hypothetical protein
MGRLALAAAVLAVVGLSAAAATGALGDRSDPPQGAPPPPSALELRGLAQLALGSATLAGDAHPTDAVVVPTTRHIAEQIDAGDGGEASTPSYFVLLHGHFTVDEAPAGGRFPTGTILTLTVDARTNHYSDYGVGSRMPDLDAIGIPEPLPLPSGSG